jgi:DNA-binding protein HU-beta
MAKSKDKGDKKAKAKGPAGETESRAEQVRAAVAGAFGATAQGAAPVRERAQDLADELVGAASRFREVLEELRPPTLDELTAMRKQVAALEERVAALEAAAAAKPPTRARSTRAASGTTAAKSTRTTAAAKGASASPGASTARRSTAAAKRPATGDDTPA